jgi:hypothetical protein
LDALLCSGYATGLPPGQQIRRIFLIEGKQNAFFVNVIPTAVSKHAPSSACEQAGGTLCLLAELFPPVTAGPLLVK